MTDDEREEWRAWFRAEFEKILAKTEGAEVFFFPSFEPVVVRRYRDDLGSGRIALSEARIYAQQGLSCLFSDDLHMGEAIHLLNKAKDSVIEACWGHAQEPLGKRAGSRGRRPQAKPRTVAGKAKDRSERDRRLAEAYQAKVAAGHRRGKRALLAAIASDAWLVNACKGVKESTLYAAVSRRLGKK